MRISDWSSDVCSSDLLLALQPLEFQHLIDATLDGLPIGAELQHHVLRCTQTAAIDPAHADLAHVSAVVQRNNLNLQRTVGIVLALRNILEYGVAIGRAHVCTPVTNAHIECSHLIEKKNEPNRIMWSIPQ